MRYTDFVLLAREPRIVKAEGKKRLTFSLLAPGPFNDPVPRELEVIAVGDLKDKAGGPEGPDFDWNDARRLGVFLPFVAGAGGQPVDGAIFDAVEPCFRTRVRSIAVSMAQRSR